MKTIIVLLIMCVAVSAGAGEVDIYKACDAPGVVPALRYNNDTGMLTAECLSASEAVWGLEPQLQSEIISILERAQYYVGGWRSQVMTLEYCDELCQAERQVERVKARQKLQDDIEAMLKRLK